MIFLIAIMFQDNFNELQHLADSGTPLFHARCSDFEILYSPGQVFVVSTQEAAQLRYACEIVLKHDIMTDAGVSKTIIRVGEQICRHSEYICKQVKAQNLTAFAPECLMILHNQGCELACTYCYAMPENRNQKKVSQDEMIAATKIVAESCCRNGKRMHVVFHGGGEPMLDQVVIEKYLPILEKIAANYGVAVGTYMATNGVTSADNACWLSENIDMVGLSFDGPPDIQNRQRPYRNGRPTAKIVERTGRILSKGPSLLHVRTTITPDTITRQAEIVEYIQNKFAPAAIRLEPLFNTAHNKTKWSAKDASLFVQHFMNALVIAKVPLLTSVCRPYELYGAYCYMKQQTLAIVPGGGVTACFKKTDIFHPDYSGWCVGMFNPKTMRYTLNTDRIAAIRKLCSAFPPSCGSCFNHFHCTLGCPDICQIKRPENTYPPAGFLCDVQRCMTQEVIFEAARTLWKEANKRGISKARFCSTPLLPPVRETDPEFIEL